MSAPVMAPGLVPGHIHLPSVHRRDELGNGFDYEENFFVRGRGSRQRIERVIYLAMLEREEIVMERETFDVLCPSDAQSFVDSLEALTWTDPLTGESPAEVAECMEQRAALELARQARIAAGEEQACLACGCSMTRACSGGCIWATKTLCSRCLS